MGSGEAVVGEGSAVGRWIGRAVGAGALVGRCVERVAVVGVATDGSGVITAGEQDVIRAMSIMPVIWRIRDAAESGIVWLVVILM